jgi:hypothetical protein
MSLVYNQFKSLEADGTINLLTDTIKVMLVGSTYTANADDSFVNPSIAGGQELNGTGYVGGYAGSGRKTLASKVVTRDDTNDRAEFSAAPLTWSAINAGTIAAAVIIRERAATGDTMSELIGYINTGGFPFVTNGGDFTLQWNAEGILQLT